MTLSIDQIIQYTVTLLALAGVYYKMNYEIQRLQERIENQEKEQAMDAEKYMRMDMAGEIHLQIDKKIVTIFNMLNELIPKVSALDARRK